LLDPAAQLIEGRHPLAATLLRRAMIEDTLNGAKSSLYKPTRTGSSTVASADAESAKTAISGSESFV